ncbi:MAG: SCP2 sterol-binding domain-containing protein [Acidobacteriota bacterium]
MELAKLFSQEGGEALRAAINAQERWQKEAAGWTAALGLVVEQSAGSQALLVKLENGTCQEIRPVAEAELEQADFVLRGSESLWRGILSGQVDPVGAVFMGKLKVTKGNVMALSARTGAARLLLETAKGVLEGLA